jgi:hypothetical protein
MRAEKKKVRSIESEGNSESKIINLFVSDFGDHISVEFMTPILHLATDRWIGMEGIMAVQAYPEKSWALFWTCLTAKTEAGNVDKFQEISKSFGMVSDSKKFRFGEPVNNSV